jgi:hypothetical protein
MPNTFAPRALEKTVKARTQQLRLDHDGPAADITEWHAIIDMMCDDPTDDFLDHYSNPSDIPDVVDTPDDDGA